MRRQPSSNRTDTLFPYTALVRSLEVYIATLPVARSVSRGSALKFCLMARGEADVYPRTGPTMEWDTAAGHAVLLAAGGTLTPFDGQPLLYSKPEFRTGPFLARGGRASESALALCRAKWWHYLVNSGVSV